MKADVENGNNDNSSHDTASEQKVSEKSVFSHLESRFSLPKSTCFLIHLQV